MTDHHLLTPEHALLVGLTVGTLLREGLEVCPEYDADGIYLATFTLSLGEGQGEVRLLVLDEQPLTTKEQP
jgi:hypothetical protein